MGEKRLKKGFNYFKILFHCAALCSLAIAYGTLYLILIRFNFHLSDLNPLNLEIFYQHLLTLSCVSFQLIFLGFSLLHDLFEWNEKHETNLGIKIRYWRDVLFSGCVVPFTLFVSSMFWTVYAIDRELVFPKVFDEIVPWWFNHCVHTNIVVVVVLETLLQPRRHPTDKKVELYMYWGVAVVYAVVYYTIYFATDRWLYQVFGVMTWWQVCLYQLWIWASSYIFYEIQFPINRLFHREERREIADNNGEIMMLDASHSPKVQHAKIITDLKVPPFSTRSWSVKFRNLKNHFESSRL